MKKFIKTFMAAALCASSVFTVAGCGGGGSGECKHDVGNDSWEVLTAATCTSEGIKEGVCSKCYEEVQEVIPVNPSAHVYGEWQVTAPTAETTGNAHRVCTENEKHAHDVVLPVISNDDYTSSITLRPSPTQNGIRTYVYRSNKTITFDVPIDRTAISTVRDGVELGAGEESHALVRSATGSADWQHYEDNKSTPTLSSHTAHFYEMGVDYTHITEKDGALPAVNRWYFKDNEGTVYGLTDRNGGGKIVDDLLDSSSTEKYINGSRLYIQYSTDIGYFFGVESLLDGLYRAARGSDNGDFVEGITEEEGKKVFHFSFGKINNSGDSSGYFTKASVRFTLTADYVIDWVCADVTVYVNNSQQTSGEAIKTWDIDEDGNAYVLNEKGERYEHQLEFTQTLKSPDDEPLVNPHTADKMYIQSFDITYYDDVLEPGQQIEFTSGKFTDYIFGITNIQPQSALNDYGFDSLGFYLRQKDEVTGKTVDYPINEGTMSELHFTVYMNSEKKFFLNSQLSGNVVVVIKSKMGVERTINCKIGAQAPSKLHPAVYEYKGVIADATDGYVWDRSSTENSPTSLNKTIYVGQPLYFTADVPSDEKTYASASYTAAVTTAPSGVDKTQLLGGGVEGGEPVSRFVADKAGSYTITLTADLPESGGAQCTINVTVVAKPTWETLTATQYTQVINSFYQENPTAGDLTVTFSELKHTYENVEGENGTTRQLVKTEMTATISCALGDEVLQLTYDYAEKIPVLTSEHTSGREFGFTISQNEAYDFVISHYSTQFLEYETHILQEKNA